MVVDEEETRHWSGPFSDRSGISFQLGEHDLPHQPFGSAQVFYYAYGRSADLANTLWAYEGELSFGVRRLAVKTQISPVQVIFLSQIKNGVLQAEASAEA